MTAAQERKLNLLIDEFGEAAADKYARGGRSTDTWKEIDERYAKTRKDLKEFVASLTEKAK